MSLDLYAGSKSNAEIAAALPLCIRCGKKHYADVKHEGQCKHPGCPEDALRLDGRGRYDVTGKKFAAHCAAHRLSRSERDPYEEAQERNREYEAGERERMRQLRSFNAKEASRPLAEALGQPESLKPRSGRVTAQPANLPGNELFIERRILPSRSEATRVYAMVRTPGGWHHLDSSCDGWAIRNRCSHVDDLNKETGMETNTAIVPRSALAIIEELDELAIIASVSGQVTKEWIYEFPQDGGMVRGLSVNGVEEAARELGKHGEAIREMDVRCEYEDDREARFVARAGRYAVDGETGREVLLDVAIRAKRQSKFIALNRGGEKFNESWFETGIAKAVRNAKEALLPESAKALIIAKAIEAGRVGRPAQHQEQPRQQAKQLEPEAPTLSVAATLKAQSLAILAELKDSFPKDEYALVWGNLKARFPEAVTSQGKWLPERVSDANAEALIHYLDAVRMESTAEPAMGPEAVAPEPVTKAYPA